MDAFPFHMTTFEYLSNSKEDEQTNQHKQSKISANPIGYGYVGGELPPRAYPNQQWNDPPMIGEDTAPTSHSLPLTSNYGKISSNHKISASSTHTQNIIPPLNEQVSQTQYGTWDTSEYPAPGSSQHYLTSNSQQQSYEQTTYPSSTLSPPTGPGNPNTSNLSYMNSQIQSQYSNIQPQYPIDQGSYFPQNTPTYPTQSVGAASISSNISQANQLENIEVPSEPIPLTPLVPLPPIQV